MKEFRRLQEFSYRMSDLPCTQVLSCDTTEQSVNENQLIGWLVVNETEFPINVGETKIGRDPISCSIRLTNPTLSQIHAVIESDGPDETVIYDFGSTNKTKLGKLVLKPHIRHHLQDGAQITFGNIIGVFKAYNAKVEDSFESQSLLTINLDETPSSKPAIRSSRQSVFCTTKLPKDDFPTQNPVQSSTPNNKHEHHKPDQEKKSPKLTCSQKENEFYELEENRNANSSSDTKNKLRWMTKDNAEVFSSPKTPDVFNIATQCHVNKLNLSILDEETQVFKKSSNLHLSSSFADVFDVQTQCQKPAGKVHSKRNEIFEVETQAKLNCGLDSNDLNSHSFNLTTRSRVPKAFSNSNVDDYQQFDLNDSGIFKEATQFQVQSRKNETGYSCTSPDPDVSDDESLQKDIKRNSSFFNAATQCQLNNSVNSSSDIFNAFTQCPVEIRKKSPSDIFEAATQCPVKTDQSDLRLTVLKNQKEPHVRPSPPKEKRKSQLDDIFDATTQKVIAEKKVKHDSLSPKSLMDDGQDDVLYSFMSTNSPNLNPLISLKREIKLEEKTPNHIDSDTDIENHMMSTDIADKEKSIIEGDSDSNSTQVYECPTINDSVFIMSDEDGNTERDLQKDEDLEATQIYKNPRKPLNEDDLPTQMFNKKSEVTMKPPIVVEIPDSGDETESDIEVDEDNFKVPLIFSKMNVISEDLVSTQVFNSEVQNKSSILKRSTTTSTTLEDEDLVATQQFNLKETILLANRKDSIATKNLTSPSIEDLVPTQRFDLKETNASTKNLDSFVIKRKAPSIRNNEDFVATQPFLSEHNTCVVPESSGDETDSDLEIDDREIALPERVTEEAITIENTTSSEESEKFIINDSRSCSPSLIPDEAKEAKIEEKSNIDSNNKLEKTDLNVLAADSDSDETDCEGVQVENENVFKTPLKKTEEYDSDWLQLSLEMPSTQDFQSAFQNSSPSKFPSLTPLKFTSPLKRDSSMKRTRDQYCESPSKKKIRKIDFDDDKDIFDDSTTDWDKMSLELPSTPDFQKTVGEALKSGLTPKKTVPSLSKSLTPKKIVKPEPIIIDQNSPSLAEIKISKSPSLTSGISLPRPRRSIKPTWKVRLKVKEELDVIDVASGKSSCSSDSDSCNGEKTLRRSGRKRKGDITSPSPGYFKNVTVSIVFTGFESESQVKIITTLGGVRTSNLTEANVLVTDKVRRTVKFLSAIGLGLPIVSPNWLVRCEEENQFLDPWNFLLIDVEAERRYNFSLKTTLQLSRKSKLLKGYNVFATANAKPPPAELRTIVESCGGKTIISQPDVWPEKSLVISCLDDISLWPKTKQRRVKIVDVEIILIGVLRHNLDFKTYKLR